MMRVARPAPWQASMEHHNIFIYKHISATLYYYNISCNL